MGVMIRCPQTLGHIVYLFYPGRDDVIFLQYIFLLYFLVFLCCIVSMYINVTEYIGLVPEKGMMFNHYLKGKNNNMLVT